MYTANQSMDNCCLSNADGDFLIVPQQGPCVPCQSAQSDFPVLPRLLLPLLLVCNPLSVGAHARRGDKTPIFARPHVQNDL